MMLLNRAIPFTSFTNSPFQDAHRSSLFFFAGISGDKAQIQDIWQRFGRHGVPKFQTSKGRISQGVFGKCLKKKPAGCFNNGVESQSSMRHENQPIEVIDVWCKPQDLCSLEAIRLA